jgi:hypothetical protein
MSHAIGNRGLQVALIAFTLAAAALAIAALARTQLVEPAHWSAACDAAPWQGAWCPLRTALIEAFVSQRIGWVALAAALVAAVLRKRPLAYAALGLGCAGLVLYSVSTAAPAVLVAALVLVRTPDSPR